jgi:hypothetical protein
MNMEIFVLLRDECRALSNALELAMIDGADLGTLRERCWELAGSLIVFAGPAGAPERIGVLVAEAELERERRETGRLRIEVRECHAELEKAVDVAVKAAEQNEELVRKLAELGEQLGRP